MENPVIKVLRQTGCSVLQLAAIADIDVSRIYQIQRGAASRISPRVLAALARLGADPDQVQQEYLEWRQQLAEPLTVR
jgi:transcriptional regulator with XRE-family HTH domain